MIKFALFFFRWTVAQVVEHDTFNVGVEGSNPSGPTNAIQKSSVPRFSHKGTKGMREYASASNNVIANGRISCDNGISRF